MCKFPTNASKLVLVVGGSVTRQAAIISSQFVFVFLKNEEFKKMCLVVLTWQLLDENSVVRQSATPTDVEVCR